MSINYDSIVGLKDVKEAYKTNQFEVGLICEDAASFTKELTANYNIENELFVKQDSGIGFVVNIGSDGSSSQLLRFLNQPQLHSTV